MPFDPATSRRRFSIGAPDGVSAVILRPLLATLSRFGPGIDVAVRQILPVRGETAPERAWRMVFETLDARRADIAIIPSEALPPRFECRQVYEEDFVIGVRAGHPFARRPNLEHYCAQRHLLVSEDGDPQGFVDGLLARQGRSRRIALTVPNFMMALAIVADSDLVCALPRRFVALHGPSFGVRGVEPPLALPRFRLNAVVPRVALLDGGIAWLIGQLTVPAPGSGAEDRRTRVKPRRARVPSRR